ncbi:hypothetical protein D0T49_03490 [Paludibacter sp. 221]|uniref:putative polyvalent protein kinase domain-containing protein n=1 Tax=Paludibacter sp. 221 TaxID=2302939 RepID=UPI0013D54554|nr:hypothetical protein [Paludibacter sp. 221]NDV46104.1 hypothetical protein [Paludibacter sp. 221]
MNENLTKLHNNLTSRDSGFTISLEQFSTDMQDANKRRRLYDNLTSRDKDFTVPYEQFSVDMGFPPTNEAAPYQSKKQAVEREKGFWNTWAGDLLEKFGAGVVNTGAGLLSMVEKAAEGSRIPITMGGDYIPDHVMNSVIAGEYKQENLGLGNKLQEKGAEISQRADRYGTMIDPKTGAGRKVQYSDLFKEGKILSGLGEIMLTATESAPTSLVAMIPGAGLPLIVTSAAGQKLNELESDPDTKDMPEWKKMLNAAVSGSLEGITEKLGAKVDAKMIEPFLSKMTETTVKGILKKGGINALIQTVTEGAEEVVSQLGENAIDAATGVSETYRPFEGVLDAFVYGAGGGAQFGGVTAGTSAYRAGDLARRNRKQNTILENIVNPVLPENFDFDNVNNYVYSKITFVEAKRAMDEALQDTGFTFNPDVAGLVIEDQKQIVSQVLQDESLSTDQKEAIVNYIATAALEKQLQAARQNLINENLISAEQQLKNSVNQKTGTLVSANILGDENAQGVFITGGVTLGIDENNEINPYVVDVENSDEAIYYFDKAGKVQVTTAENVEIVDQSSLEDSIAQLHDRYSQENEQQEAYINSSVRDYFAQVPKNDAEVGDMVEQPDFTNEERADNLFPDKTIEELNEQLLQINGALESGVLSEQQENELIQLEEEIQSELALRESVREKEVLEQSGVVREESLSPIEIIRQSAPKQENGEIDYDALLEKSPQAFATLYESEEGTAETIKELLSVAEVINNKIASAQKKLGKADSINQRKAARTEIAELQNKKNSIDGVIGVLRETPKESQESSTESQEIKEGLSAELEDANIENKPVENQEAQTAQEAIPVEVPKDGDNFSPVDLENRLNDYFDTVDKRTWREGTLFEGRDDILAKKGNYVLSIKPTKSGYHVSLGEHGIGVDNTSRRMEIESWFPGTEEELMKSINHAIEIIDIENQGPRVDSQESFSNPSTAEDINAPTDNKFTGDIIEFAQNIAKNNEIREAEEQVNTNPTEAQKEAGNYKKGHVDIQGFDVTIENPKGSVRSGVDENGTQWSVTMQNDYGYIRGTKSKDGEQIDVFIGPNPMSDTIYVVDQVAPVQSQESGTRNQDFVFDEHKVMIGFNSLEEAREAYLSNYEDGWQGLGDITPTDVETFRKWAEMDGRRIKPFVEYISIQNQEPRTKSQEPDKSAENIRFQNVREDWRDGHAASSMGYESLQEALDNGDEFNLSEVVRGFHNQPDNYFDTRVGAKYYSYDTTAGHESLTAINNVKRAINAGKNLSEITITAYRAIPKDIDVDKLKQYDWVTFSESYAQQHGEHRFGEGEYKIIKEEVPIRYVWWDSNDINEWGYDNTNEIRFQNTSSIQKSSTVFTPISREMFDSLIEQLKQTGLAKDVVTDKGEFDRKLMELSGKKNSSRVRAMFYHNPKIETESAQELIDFVKERYNNGNEYVDAVYRGQPISIRMNKDHSWNFNRNSDSSVHNLSLVNVKDNSAVGYSDKTGVIRKQVDNIKEWEDAANEIIDFLAAVEEISDLDTDWRTLLNVQFMKYPNGTVYGFVTSDGVVYLNPERMNANTPIHEFGHLWNSFTKENNSELYKKGAELIKDSEYWKRVNENPVYSNLSEEGKVDEALAMAIGDKGALLVQREKGKGKSNFNKLREWLNEVWGWIKAKLNISSDIKLEDMTLEDFTDLAVGELLGGEKIVESQESRIKSQESVDKEQDNNLENPQKNSIFVNDETTAQQEDSDIPLGSRKTELRRGNENSFGTGLTSRLRKGTGGNSSQLPITKRQDVEKRIAVDFAKEQGFWIDDLYSLGMPMRGGGNENTLAIDAETGAIYKSNNLMNSNMLVSQLLEQVEAHNSIFPMDAYSIEGVTGYDFGANSIPIVEVVLKQDYVPDAVEATQEDIDGFMQSKGYTKINDTTFTNGKYIVSDLHPRNVLKDVNGFIHVIDDIIRPATEARLQEISEMDAVRQNSIDNGTFMLAPNGKPTNLNERQWLQVRTTNFKKWFGDWENSPETASKVVDANGEPLVVYHGTNNTEVKQVWNEKTKDYNTLHSDFTIFKNTYDEQSGHFFNSEFDNAGGYGSTVYETFLNLRNPLVIDAKGSHFSDIEHNGEWKDTYEWAEYARKSRKDGVIFNNVSDGVDYGDLATPTNDYVAFAANQIKSATDNTGGFNPADNDIRYQVDGEKPQYSPDKSIGEFAKEINEWNKKIASIEKKKDALRKAHLKKEISNSEFAQKADSLSAEKSSAEKQVEALEKERNERIVPPEIESGESLLDYSVRINAWRNNIANEISEITKELNTANVALKKLRYKRNAIARKVGDINEIGGNKAEILERTRKTAHELESYIRNNLNNELADWMGLGELRSLLAGLNNPTSKKDVEAAMLAVDRTLNSIETRKNRRTLNALLNTKILDWNKKGVSIAKTVDDDTRRSVEYIRTNQYLSEAEVHERIAEIESNAENGILSPEDTQTLGSLEIIRLLSAINVGHNNVRQIDDEIRRANVEATQQIEQLKKEDPVNNKALKAAYRHRRNIIQSLQQERVAEQQYTNKAYDNVINELNSLINTGKSKLIEQKEHELKRRNEIARESIEAVYDKEIKTQAQDKELSNWERVKDILAHNKVKEFLLSPLGSFNFMLKSLDRNHPIGAGSMYERWMKGKEGALQAEINFEKGWRSFKEEVAKKAEEIFGEKFYQVINDSRKDSGAAVTYKTFEKEGENGELVPVTTTASMTKGELLYIYMTWKQAEGREKLRNMLIDEAVIDEIKETLGDKYIAFADWVQSEFLPSRRTKYNDTHKRVFFTSMAAVENYFPLKYNEKDISKPVEIGRELDFGLPSTMTGAIIGRKRNKNEIALNANAFDILMQNGHEMEEWNAYARLRKDMNSLLSNKHFRNLVDANDRTAFEKFKDSARIALKAKRDKVLDPESWAGRFNSKLAGAAIAFRINTAFKQILSYPAFMAYSANPVYQARLISNLNPYMLYRNYRWALDHLPGFKERVSSGAFGNEKLLSDGWQNSEQAAGKQKILGKAGVKADDFFNVLTKIGMKPNQFIDGLAISAGGRAIYDYKKSIYKKQGLTEEEANERALFDAAIAGNESQQSAMDVFLSPIQKSETLWARGLTTFMNANFGYLRKQVEGVLQLARSKKQYEALVRKNLEAGMNEEAAKSNALKTVLNADGKAVLNAVMFGVMLNTIWQLAEKALWGTGDDDDEKKAEIIKAIATSPIDNILGGSMISAVIDGFEPQDLMSSEIKKAYNEIVKATKAEGFISEEVALAATKTFIKFNTGINFDTWKNIYNGYEKGIKEKGGAAMAYQYFTNVPQSIRIATAQKIQQGESIGDYAKRVSLAYDNEKRFERELKSIIDKYLFSDEGDMTRFNNAIEEAKEWQVLDKGRDSLSEVAKKRLKELDENKKQYKNLLKLEKDAVSDIRKYLKGQKKYTDDRMDAKINTTRKKYDEIVDALE